MTAQTIVNLAKALEVTTDYILTGNNDAPTSKILKNLENLPSDTLNIAEKFLEIFTEGAQSYKNKKIRKKLSQRLKWSLRFFYFPAKKFL